MPVQITGVLPKQFDAVVKEALHRALDAKPQEFVVEVSWPHSELVVHIQSPLNKRLKFNQPAETELGRELFSVVTEIVDAELSH
ncbi:MAG: hypothetical protein ABSB82_01145 [Terriglobia bacterium]